MTDRRTQDDGMMARVERELQREGACVLAKQDVRALLDAILTLQQEKAALKRYEQTHLANLDDLRQQLQQAEATTRRLELQVETAEKAFLNVLHDNNRLREALEAAHDYLSVSLGDCEADCECILHVVRAALTPTPEGPS